MTGSRGAEECKNAVGAFSSHPPVHVLDVVIACDFFVKLSVAAARQFTLRLFLDKLSFVAGPSECAWWKVTVEAFGLGGMLERL